MIRRLSMVSTLVCGLSIGGVTQAQWGTPQLLIDGAQQAYGIKGGRLAGISGGGFHAVYRVFNNTGLAYRKFSGGSLGPSVVLNTGDNVFNAHLIEALNGDVHVVYEDWTTGINEVAWARSTNGGASFSGPLRISNTGEGAKFPYVAPLGSSGANVVMAYWDADANQMKYQVFNGSSWSPSSGQSFASCSSEYWTTGMCRSPLDGTVYRMYGRTISGTTHPCYKRYTGSAWESEVAVAPTGFFAWPYIAINQAGTIMMIWEQDGRIDSRWYTPGIGWSAVTVVDGAGNHGHVAAVPGTNHFYCIHTTSQNRVEGRLWVNGSWLPKVTVSVGKPSGFYPEAKMAVDGQRNLYAAWENWDTDYPLWHYNSVTGPFLAIAPVSINRQIYIGDSLANDGFLVTNGGPGNLSYTLGETSPFLSLSGTAGSSTGEDDAFTIQYAVSGLTRGVYNATITGTPSAGNSASLQVQVTVTSVKPDFDGDGDVDATDFGHLQACLSGSAVTQTDPACQDARLDVDNDVDADDINLFLDCASGTGIIADRNCM